MGTASLHIALPCTPQDLLSLVGPGSKGGAGVGEALFKLSMQVRSGGPGAAQGGRRGLPL